MSSLIFSAAGSSHGKLPTLKAPRCSNPCSTTLSSSMMLSPAKERALTDGEAGLHPDADDTKVIAPVEAVRAGKLVPVGPRLTVPAHVLPVILADGAGRRRRRARRELLAALNANPALHRESLGCSCCRKGLLERSKVSTGIDTLTSGPQEA